MADYVEGEVQVEEEETSKTKGGSYSASTSSRRDGGFILHQIEKTDTIAGIAIRYGLTVFDLKRVNGLHAEIDMFSRITLLIPSKNSESEDTSDVGSVAQLAESLGRRDMYGKKISIDSLGIRAGYPKSEFFNFVKQMHTGASSWNTFLAMDDCLDLQPQEIELERVCFQQNHGLSPNFKSKFTEREVRRRKKDNDDADDDDDDDDGDMSEESPLVGSYNKKKLSFISSSSSAFPSRVLPQFKNCFNSFAETMTRHANTFFSDDQNTTSAISFITSSSRSENIISKIKRAANRPALAGYENSSLSSSTSFNMSSFSNLSKSPQFQYRTTSKKHR